MKKVLVLAISLTLLLSILPAGAYAEKDSGKDEGAKEIAEEIIRQNRNRDPFDYLTQKEKGSLKLNAERPGKWNLSDKIFSDGLDDSVYVTPVKFQNPFGTCWGFASIAAAETSILGSGLAAADGYAAEADPDNGVKELDLSEKHLVYFINKQIDDPSHSQYGEGITDDGTLSVPDKLNMGGRMTFAAGLFAAGIGVNLEDRVDPNDDNRSMKDILSYRGKNGTVMKRNINGVRESYCYDDEDDWSIPSKYRFYQSYSLKQAYELPSPAGKNDNGEYVYNEAGTLAIKDQLLANRAVAIGFHADSYMPSQEAGDGQYISKKWAHYTYNPEGANHGVTIVGYDDSYPKENFVEGHQPPENGAWLVKNSWGSGEEEFPNKGPGNWGIENEDGKGTGYFWLSYYDQSISMLEAFEFDKSNVGKKYYVDQYDYMPVNQVYTLETEYVNKMANVFRAEECEVLDQVTCVTTRPGTRVTNKIYILNDNFKDPEDGVLVAECQDTFELGGFHKMDVGIRQMIQKNQYYSVVQTLELPDGQGYETICDQGYGKKTYEELLKDFGINTWTVGIVNKKESYFYSEKDGWDDYRNIVDYLDSGEDEGYFSYDNFPIKAYCTPKENMSLIVDDSVRVFTAGPQISADLRVQFRGDADVDLNGVEVSWELEEGGDEFAAVEPHEDDHDKATLTGKKAGTTRLIVTAEGVGKSVVNVIVEDPEVFVFMMGKEFVYNGKPQKPEIVVYNSWYDFFDEDQYRAAYKNNVKCGKASVTITPVDDIYHGSVTAEFTILPQKALIKDLKPGKKSLTVTLKDQKKSGVSKYEVQYRKAGSKKWSKKTFSAKKNKIVLKNLKKGKKYEVKARAFAKNAGYGKMSKINKSSKIK